MCVQQDEGAAERETEPLDVKKDLMKILVWSVLCILMKTHTNILETFKMWCWRRLLRVPNAEVDLRRLGGNCSLIDTIMGRNRNCPAAWQLVQHSHQGKAGRKDESGYVGQCHGRPTMVLSTRNEPSGESPNESGPAKRQRARAKKEMALCRRALIDTRVSCVSCNPILVI